MRHFFQHHEWYSWIVYLLVNVPTLTLQHNLWYRIIQWRRGKMWPEWGKEKKKWQKYFSTTNKFCIFCFSSAGTLSGRHFRLSERGNNLCTYAHKFSWPPLLIVNILLFVHSTLCTGQMNRSFGLFPLKKNVLAIVEGVNVNRVITGSDSGCAMCNREYSKFAHLCGDRQAKHLTPIWIMPDDNDGMRCHSQLIVQRCHTVLSSFLALNTLLCST